MRLFLLGLHMPQKLVWNKKKENIFLENRGKEIMLKATCDVQLKITFLPFKGSNLERPHCKESKLSI